MSVAITNKATAVLGAQWGDEGKGKLVDLLCCGPSSGGAVDVVCRFAGGNNAGHTIVVNGQKFDFHLLPSGLIVPGCANVIGSGCVIGLRALFSEIDKTESKGISTAGRLWISDRAHLVLDVHCIIDGLKEGELSKDSASTGGKIGTTGKGIGPAYSSKASRGGLRIHHLWDKQFESKFRTIVANKMRRYGTFEYDIEKELSEYKVFAERLKPMVLDTSLYVHKALKDGKRVLIEGANALMLDIDHGTYPYVTSSSASVGGICTGLGIPPPCVGNVIGVVKAYTTRVGEGPFPTEQLNDIGQTLQRVGAEVGTTTGRARRCGWLDTVVLSYSNRINGYTALNLTKLDVLDGFDRIRIGVGYARADGSLLPSFPADLSILEQITVVYEEMDGWRTDISGIRSWDALPAAARKYVERIEEIVGVPVVWIGVGPGREAMIHRPPLPDGN